MKLKEDQSAKRVCTQKLVGVNEPKALYVLDNLVAKMQMKALHQDYKLGRQIREDLLDNKFVVLRWVRLVENLLKEVLGDT